jgi:hypothetical protein
MRSQVEEVNAIIDFEYDEAGVHSAARLIVGRLKAAEDVKRLLRREHGGDIDGSRKASIKMYENEAKIGARVLDLVVPLPDGREWHPELRELALPTEEELAREARHRV